MVRQWQELFYERRYSAVKFQVIPDFVKLAEAYGALGLRATKIEEVEPILKQALESDRLTLVDIHIAPEEGVFPMVPAGRATTEMILV